MGNKHDQAKALQKEFQDAAVNFYKQTFDLIADSCGRDGISIAAAETFIEAARPALRDQGVKLPPEPEERARTLMEAFIYTAGSMPGIDVELIKNNRISYMNALRYADTEIQGPQKQDSRISIFDFRSY